ncbi:hypothetical protein [Lysobacter gummosus]|uniref:hypothetical protein n=1 Tax=Lysobacter gummosus TaxID=262324 RepID=UPI00363D9455
MDGCTAMPRRPSCSMRLKRRSVWVTSKEIWRWILLRRRPGGSTSSSDSCPS